ncbi:MAG: citrate/2-methylcitrate synthase [Pseudomonadota bacterium]
MHKETNEITQIIVKAAEKARRETAGAVEPEHISRVDWPIQCTVGPGLEGAIACESKIGYVNGSKGWLVYRGYDIFDLSAYCTYEEVCYLLLHGELPTSVQLDFYKGQMAEYRRINTTLRKLMGFRVEEMNAMAALRLGTELLRQDYTCGDREIGKPPPTTAIASDEDSIAMETAPRGQGRATFEFKRFGKRKVFQEACGIDACNHLIAGVSTIAAAIARLHQGLMPIEPDPELGHAANFLLMMTGRHPSPVEARLMDIALILHADHGMNASTFASMVVASTLSDVYFSAGAGIAALNGPLHGGANEHVVRQLREIGDADNIEEWVDRAIAGRRKISGFGHRVYKAYDPRARVLGPLARFAIYGKKDMEPLYRVARKLERAVVDKLGAKKKIFPNVDFYSGLIYSCMGIAPEMFTPVFAVSRMAGWTARVTEYLQNNRIFRPRGIYTGEFERKVVPIQKRG